MRFRVTGIRAREAWLALMVLVVSGLVALAEPRFLNASNLVSVGTGMIYDLPVAAGMTLVLALGGIDLSVGAVIGFASIIHKQVQELGVAIQDLKAKRIKEIKWLRILKLKLTRFIELQYKTFSLMRKMLSS